MNYETVRVASGNNEVQVLDEMLSWFCSKVYDLGEGKPTVQDYTVMGTLAFNIFIVSTDPTVVKDEKSQRACQVMQYLLHRFYDPKVWEVHFDQSLGWWTFRKASNVSE
jgi:hypothetical protein